MKEILEIFVCCLEICIPYWWTGKLAEKRKLRCGIKVLWNICLLIWIGLLYYQRMFFLYSRWYLLFEIAGTVLLARWRYRIRWRDAFAVAGIFYESLYFLYLMTLIAVEYSAGYDVMMKIHSSINYPQIRITAVSVLLISVAFEIIYRVQKQSLEIYGMMENRLVIVPVIQHLLLGFCDQVFFEPDRLFVLKQGFFGMLGCLCIFLILAISYIYKKGKYEVNELEKRADAAEQKYQERIEGDRERDILVHDIRNHLIVIDSILQNGEADRARNYIDKLQEDYCNIRQSFHTGSVVVDAILGSKAYQAENAGIRFKIVSDDLSDSFVSDRDWCSILSNLLDNAIEACGKMEGKGWIRIRLENRPFGMVWVIENTCPDPQDDRTEAKPKRRGGRHGTGLQSVRYAIQKYNGFLDQKRENHIFRTTLVLYREMIK